MARKSSLVETLRARWIAKRSEFIAGKRVPLGFHDGPDDYARRELRAYRLAQVWARDLSLPGDWYWVKRDQRWDVYPQSEACTLMRVVRSGPWHELFYPDGTKARVGYILSHRADPIARGKLSHGAA
jgi:hypothetical protein